MPNGMLTLLDVVKQTGNQTAQGVIETVVMRVPEVRVVPTEVIDGTHYEALVRTEIPDVGFRHVNEGTDPVKSGYDRQLSECFLLDGLIKTDKANADAAGSRKAALMAREVMGIIWGAWRTVGRQFFYGRKADKKGFFGLSELVEKEMTIGNKSAGLSPNTGSSVYAVYLDTNEGVSFILGGQGTGILAPDVEWTKTLATDSGGKSYEAYYANLQAWIGLRVLNPLSIAKYDNLTEQEGQMLDDRKLARLVDVFQEKSGGIRPSHLFMSYRSRSQLRDSREIALYGIGKTRPDQPGVVPTPTEWEGIPIEVTDSLRKDEPIVPRT